MPTTEERTFSDLTEEECWQRLGSHVLGRLAVCGDDGAAPVVLPLNYVVDGRTIVFRTASGTKLTLLRNHDVAFEVDHVDLPGASGWSVLIRGRAQELTHWESDHLRIPTWVPGDRRHFIRIVAESITGRLITPGQWIDARSYL